MAFGVGTPGYIIERCKGIRNNWTTRTKKFKDWYDVLLLTDELEQPGMESVTTNDPRTGYNLGKHLLTSMVIADKIPVDDLAEEFVPATTYLEKYMTRVWKDQERRYRSAGRQGWTEELVAWLLATGWYSVFAMVDDKNIWAEVWSPADCFQDFGPDGLVEHAHIYTLTPIAAYRKLRSMGWTVQGQFTGQVTFYDHWTFDADGDVVNAVACSATRDEFVKPPVKDKRLSKLSRLPIFTSAAGGLPDRGSIKGNNLWQNHYGESIIATNEELNANYNRMRSFYQQAARSGAQHHWLETSAGDTPIATQAQMDMWGSILRGAPGEDVKAIQPTSMPVELTNLMYIYQNELQRGLFPAALHGNVQQQMSYLAMANAASSAMQVLVPYRDGIKGLRSDIDNFCVDMIMENGIRPRQFKVPDKMPPREDRQFDVDTTIEIPGYLVQRATVARMLNPNFRLPNAWITERMFPEITNMLQSQADVRAEEAMMTPEAILVDSIIAYRERARISRESDPPDIQTAELYEKLATLQESKLEPQPQQPPPGAAGPGSIPPTSAEVLPRDLATPIEGLGRTS